MIEKARSWHSRNKSLDQASVKNQAMLEPQVAKIEDSKPVKKRRSRKKVEKKKGKRHGVYRSSNSRSLSK